MPTFRGESGKGGKRKAETMTLIHAFLWGFLSLDAGFLLLFVVVVINEFLIYRDLRKRLREQNNWK